MGISLSLSFVVIIVVVVVVVGALFSFVAGQSAYDRQARELSRHATKRAGARR